MKRLTYLFVLFHLGGFAATAQTYTAIKAGGALSTLQFNTINNLRARVTWYGGIMANFDVREQFFIRTEFLYSLRGYHQQASATAIKGEISYSYLSVPLLAGYTPVKNLSIMAGPELGYMLSARSKDEYNTTNITGFVNSRFNIDANAGISYALSPELSVETHFLIGLTPLYGLAYLDALGNNAGSSRDGFHRVIQLGIIYKMSGN